jgi:hypothetical protein
MGRADRGGAQPGPDEADEYAQGPPDRVWSRELLLGEELEAWVRHVGDCISWAICHQLFDAGNPVEFDDGMAIEFDDRIAQLASVIDQLGAARLGGGGTDRAAWQATYASLRQWFPAMNTRAGRELAAGLMNDRLADPDADPVAVPAGTAA